MAIPIQQLAMDLKSVLSQYRPRQPRPFTLKTNKRNVTARMVMRRLRERRRRQGLNASGKPLLEKNKKYIARRYRQLYPKKP